MEIVIPSGLPSGKCVGEALQYVVPYLQAEPSPDAVAADQPRSVEHPHVMRQQRRRDVEPLTHLARPCVLLSELLDDRQSHRIGERPKRRKHIEAGRR